MPNERDVTHDAPKRQRDYERQDRQDEPSLMRKLHLETEPIAIGRWLRLGHRLGHFRPLMMEGAM
jgi:hypothetical protein